MKNHLMPLLDKLLLRKRFSIETLIGQTEVTHGVGAHPTPIAQKRSGPYLLLSCRLHPCATQSQHGASGHAASGLALSIIRVSGDK